MMTRSASYIPPRGIVMTGTTRWAQTLNIVWDFALAADLDGGIRESDIPAMQAKLDEILGKKGLPLADLRVSDDCDLFAEPTRRALA
tara:strand:+ start:112 stop:372 length:261 start_codon:yes stop_codon:yes gene_type:complete